VLREIKYAKEMNHPNLVQLKHVIQGTGKDYPLYLF